MLAVNPIGKLLLGRWIYVQKPFVPAVGISPIHLSTRQGIIDCLLFALPSYIGNSAIPEIIRCCHGRDFRVLLFEEKAIFHQMHNLPGPVLAQFLIQAVNIRKRGAYEGIGGDSVSVM